MQSYTAFTLNFHMLEDTKILVWRIPGGYELCEYNIPRAAQNIDGAPTQTNSNTRKIE